MLPWQSGLINSHKIVKVASSNSAYRESPQGRDERRGETCVRTLGETCVGTLGETCVGTLLNSTRCATAAPQGLSKPMLRETPAVGRPEARMG